MMKKRHFEIHGHFNQIVPKKRCVHEELENLDQFFTHVSDKLEHRGFTHAMEYILTSLTTLPRHKPVGRIDYKIALSSALDHFSASAIIQAFETDFANDDYFAGDNSLSAIPLTPKIAFISGFSDFFLEKVMLA
jgi:hypothetical protein